MKKKVLITVSGGVPTAFADTGVDVVIVDFDDLKITDPNEIIPIHRDFLPLMEFAGATDTWPTSDDGRTDDAEHIESFDEEPTGLQTKQQHMNAKGIVEILR